MATPPASRRPPPPPPKTTAKARPVKTFQASAWTGHGEGEKVIVYGVSGIGKTSLLAQFPGARFIGLDDGGRKIRTPAGEPVSHVEGVETFEDVRDALHQDNLWEPGGMCVIDTLTILETLAEPYMFATIPHEKGGLVTHLEGYGFGKGYVHLYDTMRLILQDLDQLIRRGVHLGLICQNATMTKANAGGLEYLEDNPQLSHTKQGKASVLLAVISWADHVIRIGTQGVQVVARDVKDKVGKAIGTPTRLIHTQAQSWFFAKTRTLSKYPTITFDDANDTSFWQFLFPGREF